ncbi:unnamed protein product [Vicia faba]|uniref:Uncharacterized protein n=1 Tax=Vicia faba TaxID=3906 RepID=A0AAV1AM36_VICFA|nr:unnamed protein product [Vicia faba]
MGFLALLLLLLLPVSSAVDDLSPFPTNFLFGTASSSYQYEGGYNIDGKGQSNWDNFTHGGRSMIVDGSNGDIAVDHYHRYKEDIDLLEALNVNSYRLSISWTRILPKGRFGEINWAGIDFYNKLFDALLLKDLCFNKFGDRVKYWVTFNEPNNQVPLGYRSGIYPPSRCSGSLAMANCKEGDSEKEPFIAAHNIILSHAAAVDLYRTKYQVEQRGRIGIVLQHEWYEPMSNSTADKLATERARSFTFNWFLDPIIFGKYPKEMENILGNLLPKFSTNEKKKLKKGLDFIGINYYTASYVQDCIHTKCDSRFGISRTEGSYMTSGDKNGISIGESTPFSWFNVYPQGLEKTVTYVKDRYNNTPMFITENGYGQQDDPNFTLEDQVNDLKRIKYMENHIEALSIAIRKGADVRGYFAWSLLDNFEWIYGYTVRYGFHHVDYATLKRTPRLSATWYKQFIANYTQTKFIGIDKLVQST